MSYPLASQLDRVFIIFLCLCCSLSICTQTAYGQLTPEPVEEQRKSWIFNGESKNIQGIGVVKYSRFNPEKSWDEAFELAINDLNANHSLLVYYSGSQIGQGPLRTKANYAIRNFLGSTQVAVIDSTVWNEHAFILVEPKTPVSNSLIYPQKKFRTVKDSLFEFSTNSTQTQQWIRTRGSAPRIDSNWYLSITKAKQNALRKLARDLAVKTSVEIYSENNVQRRYYNFSTVYAFQRIKTLQRSFNADSFQVQLAIDPNEIKMLIEE